MPSDKRNSFWLAFQFAITLVFSLVALKLNILNFGSEKFGIWILLASIWGFGSALDFGFGTAVVKYVAEHKEDKAKVDRLLSSSLLIFLIIGLAILIIGSSVGNLVYLQNQKLVNPGNKKNFVIVFTFLGFAFYSQYISLFYKAIIEGLSNFVLTSKLTIGQNSIILVGVSVIYLMKLSLIALSVLYLAAYSIILILYISYFKLIIKKYTISFKLFDFLEVKKIIGFSLSVQAMSAFNALIDPVVKYMLGTYLNIKIIPAYEIARRFAIAVSGLFFNVFKIVLPKASVLKSRMEIKNFILTDLVKYSKFGIMYSGLAFGVFTLPIICIIYFIFGMREAVLIYIILALPESINNFGYATYNFLLGVGKVYLLVIVQLNNFVFVIISLFIGFNIFHSLLGLIGYFVSVILGNILIFVFLKREWEISLYEFFHKCKLNKLIILILLIVSIIILVYTNAISFYIIFALFSILSYLLFMNDIYEYFNLIKESVSIKFSNKLNSNSY